MTEIVYRANEGDPDSVQWHGRTFVKDVPEIVDNPELIELARGNPSFDVDGESKEEKRIAEQRHREVEAATAELARIEAQAHELEQTQTAEMGALERKHQADRDQFLNTNEPLMIGLRATIRGSDGSDNLEPVDGGLPTSETHLEGDGTAVLVDPNAEPLPTGEVPQPSEPPPELQELQEPAPAPAPLPEPSPVEEPAPAPLPEPELPGGHVEEPTG